MLEQQIEDDIKAALLAKEQMRATVLRTIKAALLNYKVANGKRETGITDEEVMSVLAKEAKKRQESSELYKQGGSQERADIELLEKALIEQYLPAQMTETEMEVVVDETVAATGENSAQDMGMVISQVKAKAGPPADGAMIARLVKARLGA